MRLSEGALRSGSEGVHHGLHDLRRQDAAVEHPEMLGAPVAERRTTTQNGHQGVKEVAPLANDVGAVRLPKVWGLRGGRTTAMDPGF